MPNTNTIEPAVAEHATHDTTHSQRLNALRVAPEAYQVMRGFESYIQKSSLESKLMHLVKLRASYINGCAYCVDMHSKDARNEGETEQRLYAVPVWREARSSAIVSVPHSRGPKP